MLLSLAASEPTTAPFFDGGSAYNVLNLIIGAVGIVVSFVGLWIAIAQISKARSAAEAAKQAALTTADKLQRVHTLIEMTAVCALAKELTLHLTNKDYKTAAVRAMRNIREKYKGEI